MKNLTNVGRIIFGIPFLVFGINHFIYGSKMAGYVPSFIPGGVFWVYLTGLAMIAAAISIFTKRYIKLATLLLAIMLFIFVLTIHIPMVLNPETMMAAMPNLLKDVSLAGAALMLSGISENEVKKS